MLIDGKTLARDIKAEIQQKMKRLPQKPTLAVVVTDDSLVTSTYVALKQKTARDLEIESQILRPKTLSNTEDLVREVFVATRDFDGVVVQLPLARQFQLEVILKMLPITHDVDVIGETSYQQFAEGRLPIMPPVVSAMSDILFRNGFRLAGRKVAVFGEGRLVGKPAANWATRMGAEVTIFNDKNFTPETDISFAEVLILGAGSPGLITPERVRDGVVVLDAGSSEDGGKVVGDADPKLAEKAHLMTPVPGGIGPVAIAKLFENLVELTALKQRIDLRL